MTEFDPIKAGKTGIGGNLRQADTAPPLHLRISVPATSFRRPYRGSCRSPRKFAGGLLRGWTLDGIVRAQSAPPINVFFVSNNSEGYTFVQADVVPGQPFWLADANEPAAG